MWQTNHRQRGFTLIELMAAIAISGVVLGAITATFITQSRSYDAQEQINEMQQGARAAMDLITREVRMAGYNTNESLSFDGITYDTSQMRIQANLDGDGDTADANEDIIYAYDSCWRGRQGFVVLWTRSLGRADYTQSR